MEFLVEQQPTAPRLKRVAAYFRFARPRSVTLETDRFDFNPGNSIRLLFSYRHTLEVAGSLLGPHGLSVVRHWIDLSGEEGIFLVKKSG